MAINTKSGRPIARSGKRKRKHRLKEISPAVWVALALALTTLFLIVISAAMVITGYAAIYSSLGSPTARFNQANVLMAVVFTLLVMLITISAGIFALEKHEEAVPSELFRSFLKRSEVQIIVFFFIPSGLVLASSAIGNVIAEDKSAVAESGGTVEEVFEESKPRVMAQTFKGYDLENPFFAGKDEKADEIMEKIQYTLKAMPYTGEITPDILEESEYLPYTRIAEAKYRRAKSTYYPLLEKATRKTPAAPKPLQEDIDNWYAGLGTWIEDVNECVKYRDTADGYLGFSANQRIIGVQHMEISDAYTYMSDYDLAYEGILLSIKYIAMALMSYASEGASYGSISLFTMELNESYSRLRGMRRLTDGERDMIDRIIEAYEMLQRQPKDSISSQPVPQE